MLLPSSIFVFKSPTSWGFFITTRAIALFFFAISSTFATASNFYEAKLAAREIYRDHRQTFYCDCTFDKRAKIKSCKIPIKAKGLRLEWEHIVPMHRLGGQRACWDWSKRLCKNKKGKKIGGRRCCQKIDTEFNLIEADLHNLVPAIGEVNRKRSNFSFAILAMQKDYYQGCALKIDHDQGLVEPAPKTRGMIARIYFYMSQRYGVVLSQREVILFRDWDRRYPPDLWEKRRDARIEAVQGNYNPFVRFYQN